MNMAKQTHKPFGKSQRRIPSSTRMWEAQWQEVAWAAEYLGISQSRLLRSAALSVAAELRQGAQRPITLHH